MLVLIRRHKQNGKRLNLGVVTLDAGFKAEAALGKVGFSNGRPQEANVVEQLHSVTVKDDSKAVEAMLYFSGASNFQTVEA